MPALEVRLGGAPGQHAATDLEDLRRVGQPALAGVDAGEPADGGLDDDGAAAAERGHVLLGGRVLPHLGVHGGREDDRAAGGQERVGEQVVGEAVGGLGEHVGRGGRDDHQVGVLADADVRYLVDVVPDLRRDRVAGQGGPGRGADEVQRGGGGHHADVVARLREPSQQLTGLVGGDAAADPQNDPRLVHRLSPDSKTWHTHETPQARQSRCRACGQVNRSHKVLPRRTTERGPRRPRTSADRR